MYIDERLFHEMDRARLSPQARLLLLDCIRRAAQTYPGIGDRLDIPRPICVRWSAAGLGMTRPRFASARRELLLGGYLSKHYPGENTNATSRDWFMLSPFAAACEVT